MATGMGISYVPIHFHDPAASNVLLLREVYYARKLRNIYDHRPVADLDRLHRLALHHPTPLDFPGRSRRPQPRLNPAHHLR